MMHMISIASYHLFFIYSILVDCISLFAVLVCCLFTEYVNKKVEVEVNQVVFIEHGYENNTGTN